MLASIQVYNNTMYTSSFQFYFVQHEQPLINSPKMENRFILIIYSQTCIKVSPLGQIKSGLLRQVAC